MKRFLLPLGVFIALLLFLGVGLRLNPREIPSPFIGKAAPAFNLTQLHEADKLISPQDMLGKVWLLNVWASWCVDCRIEHTLLVEYSRTATVPVYGLNYKDKRDDAMRWLTNFGNPYTRSLSDTEGLVGIDFGVYGVPETFIIDKEGVIRMKQIGPVTPEVLRDDILPLLKKLNG